MESNYSRYPNFPPVVGLELDGFSDVKSEPALGELLDRMHTELVEAPWIAHEQRRTAARTRLSYERPDGRHVIFKRLTVPNWERAMRAIGSGEVRRLYATIEDPPMLGQTEADIASTAIGLELLGEEFPGEPWRLLVHCTRFLLPDRISLDQARWVDLFTRGGEVMQATYGLLTLDRLTGANTAHEEAVGRPALFRGLTEVREWVRGYQWGNILSAEHVARLGGADHVLRAAPCRVRQALKGGLIYLQLTESLDDFSDQALAGLKTFLQPVLPAGPLATYRGPPIRIVPH